jgi:hypothetical protein
MKQQEDATQREARELQEKADAHGSELMQVQSTVERLISERASLSMRAERMEETAAASSMYARNATRGIDAVEANVTTASEDSSKTKLPSVIAGSAAAGKALAALDAAVLQGVAFLRRTTITVRVALALYITVLHFYVRALLKARL